MPDKKGGEGTGGITLKKQFMYKIPQFHKTQLARNVSKQGEPLHQKIERMTKNNEITAGKITRMSPNDTKPLVYTEKSAGVIPQTDWRADKWELGAETSDKLHRDYVNRGSKRPTKANGKPESTDGKGTEGSTEKSA